MAIESDVSLFFLFTSVRRAKVNPEKIPAIAPLVILFEILNSGIINRMPIKTTAARIMFLISSFSLKNRGSIKVTKSGKVEKVTRPTATLDIWMERKKLHQ